MAHPATHSSVVPGLLENLVAVVVIALVLHNVSYAW